MSQPKPLSDDPRSTCLMTVTSASFLAGTMVMLTSFLEQNSWFDGDIRIITSDLSPDDKARLEALSKRLQVVPPSDALRSALENSVMPQSGREKRHARFASLDAFQNLGYDTVLFCDSDLLFRSSVEQALHTGQDFAACPDGAALRGNTRRREDFAEVPLDHGEPTLGQTFNTGVMVLQKPLLKGDTFSELLGVITSDFWQRTKTGHCDQAVINLVLSEHSGTLDLSFNTLLSRHVEFADMMPAPQDIKVYHYNAVQKPWDVPRNQVEAMSDPLKREAYGAWHDAFDAITPHAAPSLVTEVTKIDTHLFLLCPNNSGSTYLAKAIGTSRHVWSLPREGQHVPGFAGPSTRKQHALVWAASANRLRDLSDQSLFDWPRIQQAWYEQATAQGPDARVFFTKAPPFLSYPDALERQFHKTKFLMMVRNPYAVVESISRRYAQREPNVQRRLLMASAHIMKCFELQMANQARYAKNGLFFTYESLCADPAAIAKDIQRLVPDLDDLSLSQRLSIKGLYDEPLRNMNDDQIARLTPEHIKTINDVFTRYTHQLTHFGYDLLTTGLRR